MSTDHYKEMCDSLGRSERALNPESATLHMAAAQVHATAFVGEQQRIGNLIALASITGPESEAELTPLETTAWRALGDAETGEMLPSIREGLGL